MKKFRLIPVLFVMLAVMLAPSPVSAAPEITVPDPTTQRTNFCDGQVFINIDYFDNVLTRLPVVGSYVRDRSANVQSNGAGSCTALFGEPVGICTVTAGAATFMLPNVLVGADTIDYGGCLAVSPQGVAIRPNVIAATFIITPSTEFLIDNDIVFI